MACEDCVCRHALRSDAARTLTSILKFPLCPVYWAWFGFVHLFAQNALALYWGHGSNPTTRCSDSEGHRSQPWCRRCAIKLTSCRIEYRLALSLQHRELPQQHGPLLRNRIDYLLYYGFGHALTRGACWGHSFRPVWCLITLRIFTVLRGDAIAHLLTSKGLSEQFHMLLMYVSSPGPSNQLVSTSQ